jgi:hypothetical protein
MKVIVQDRFRIIVASPGPQGPQGPPGSGSGTGSVDWGQIGGTLSAQTDLQTALNGKAATSHTHAWADITSGVPTSFTPSAHTHAAADVTSGRFTADRLPSVTGPVLYGRAGATAGNLEVITLGSGLSIDGSKALTATGFVGTTREVIAGTGLTGGGTLDANRTFAVDFATTATAGKAVEANDPRLSDARTPTAHTHGLTDSYVGFIEAASNKTYTIDFRAATARTITDIRVQSTAGTCTAAVKNGANTVGTVSVTSTSGGSSPSLSNTSVSGSDPVSIEISSNSNAVNVSFAITYTRVTGAIS